MEFGWAFRNRGPNVTGEMMVALAEKADGLGYDSIWVTDHVVIPTRIASRYPYSLSGTFPLEETQHYLEPLTLLDYLLARTRRVRIGTNVLIIPYRPPVLTAKMLATADYLSGGRVILGAGVGWLEEEFVALGLSTFRERGAVTDEYIRAFRELWTAPEPKFEGRYCRFADIRFYPKPVQKGGIPIWIGGHTKPALRRAATLGDGWLPIGLRPPASFRPAEMAVAVRDLRAMAQQAGRNPAGVTIAFRAPLSLGQPQKAADAPPGETRLPLSGGVEDIVEDIGRYAEAGVTHLILDFTTGELPRMLEVMERFMTDVRPRVGGRR